MSILLYMHSGTILFQHLTPLCTVELLYSNTLNEDTSVYSGTILFQHPEMRTPLYTVELFYSNTLK